MSASAVVLPKNSPKQSKPRKSSVVRKSTLKPKSVQTAVTVRRHAGQSKVRIAKELGIAQNTVTSILALNSVEEEIEQYRKDAMGLVPLAITAVQTDLQEPGNGALGLRVLESTGIVGDNAIDAARRDTVRQRNAINVLVQPGATITVQSNNASVTDKNCRVTSNKQVTDEYHTGTGNAKVTEQAGPGTPQGKQPNDGVGH